MWRSITVAVRLTSAQSLFRRVSTLLLPGWWNWYTQETQNLPASAMRVRLPLWALPLPEQIVSNAETEISKRTTLSVQEHNTIFIERIESGMLSLSVVEQT